MIEHVLKGLQHLHLDEYLLFLITEDQNQKLTDILKTEKKLSTGIHHSLKQIVNEERTDTHRPAILNAVLKRLSESFSNGDHRKKKFKYLMKNMTAEQLEEQ